MDNPRRYGVTAARTPLVILSLAVLAVAAIALLFLQQLPAASVDTADPAAPAPIVTVVSSKPVCVAPMSQTFGTAVSESLVYVDGQVLSVVCDGSTVLDLLLDAGIEVGGFDIISPAPYSIPTAGEAITVRRVEYQQVERTYAEPFEVYTDPSSDLTVGEEVVQTQGSAGERHETQLLKYVDGKCVETTVLSSRVTKKPVAEVREVGTVESVSAFPSDYDILLDENDNPLTYLEKLTGTAAAYSAKPGAGTASGRKAVVGTVAVNPNTIPYGSELYIKTPDGSHIYGYAVAADTGKALMRGEIIVDIFFATNKECRKFGLKTVDVYVLAWGDNKRVKPEAVDDVLASEPPNDTISDSTDE